MIAMTPSAMHLQLASCAPCVESLPGADIEHFCIAPFASTSGMQLFCDGTHSTVIVAVVQSVLELGSC